MRRDRDERINVFQKYLTLWTLFCMIVGVLIGKYIPIIPSALGKMQIIGIFVPITVLIWIIIYPMMMKVDFQSIKKVREDPKGLFVIWAVNWLMRPFTMFGIVYSFFFITFKNITPDDPANDYLAGAVLLGAVLCTAMVLVWSTLTKGGPAHTVVRIATNDLIILFVLVPITKFLLDVPNVVVPYSTLSTSTFLFVVVPLSRSVIIRKIVVDKRGKDYFGKESLGKSGRMTTIRLLLTLVIISSSRTDIILENPFHILSIAIPLILQTCLTSTITYGLNKKVGLSFGIATPAGMIGTSNFFKLAVAVAIAVFGTDSPVALACTVGALTEVPPMLFLVNIMNNAKYWFLENKESKVHGD